MSTAAFMTDPDLLRSLEGQQYLVLRPERDVAAFYEREQAALVRRTGGRLPHPDTGHVTLRGFFEPERVDLVRDSLVAWAAAQPPIDLQVDAVDGFPPPFKVVIARLARTDSLVHAYAGLTTAVERAGLHRIGELPIDDWVFHLSLLYGGSLDDDKWEALHRDTRRDLDAAPSERIMAVDFVWYRDGVEHCEQIPLGG